MRDFRGAIICIIMSLVLSFALIMLCYVFSKSSGEGDRICVKGVVYKKVDSVYQELLSDEPSSTPFKCVEVKK